IYDRHGDVFAAYQRPGSAGTFTPPPVGLTGHQFRDDALVLFRPIARKGDSIGTLFIESDLQALSARLWEYFSIAIAVLCLAGLVSFVLSRRLQRVISDPILQLVQTMQIVAREGAYLTRAEKQSNDELGLLVDGFNHMLAQIEQREHELQASRDTLE